jgi:hypothetical protein
MVKVEGNEKVAMLSLGIDNLSSIGLSIIAGIKNLKIPKGVFNGRL